MTEEERKIYRMVYAAVIAGHAYNAGKYGVIHTSDARTAAQQAVRDFREDNMEA